MGFDKDRYDSAQLSEKWIEVDKDARTIVVDGIEVEGYEPDHEDLIQLFWKSITAIDNKVQEFCSEECKRSGEDSKNFLVDLSWVSLEDGQIEMGYWGRVVNVELRVALDDQMNITDIYFQ